jgi:hypothetical protein
MSLSNTLTINWNGGPIVLAKINQDAFTSQYRKKLSDANGVHVWEAFIRHTTTKPNSAGVIMERHNVEIRVTTNPADASLPQFVRRIYAVLENPSNADDVELGFLGDALGGLITDGGFITSLWAGES